ncbi:hypothetical protein THII_2240 [Thioploca ingrica]|uniref:HTH merR-type domain-containing protein n=1 Tax=Thioploca ingrica TaxID=40754 RepID=A0A090AL76_9GAMM|nr:hypothetical protein THII_2240 [Thioploca ingrica]
MSLQSTSVNQLALLRRWDKEGRLVAKRTLSHHRYYDESDVGQALLLPPKNKKKTPCATNLRI